MVFRNWNCGGASPGVAKCVPNVTHPLGNILRCSNPRHPTKKIPGLNRPIGLAFKLGDYIFTFINADSAHPEHANLTIKSYLRPLISYRTQMIRTDAEKIISAEPESLHIRRPNKEIPIPRNCSNFRSVNFERFISPNFGYRPVKFEIPPNSRICFAAEWGLKYTRSRLFVWERPRRRPPPPMSNRQIGRVA